MNIFPITIPPLRERREDIPLLVNYFGAKLSREMGRQIKRISPRTMEALTNHPWKGNVRELANLVERAVILSEGEELKIPVFEFVGSDSPASPANSTFQQAERDVIVNALKAASARVAGGGGAAERLGLKRTTLQNKMQKLGIVRAAL